MLLDGVYAYSNGIGDPWISLVAYFHLKDCEPNLASDDMINTLSIFIKHEFVPKIIVPSPWYAILRGRKNAADLQPAASFSQQPVV